MISGFAVAAGNVRLETHADGTIKSFEGPLNALNEFMKLQKRSEKLKTPTVSTLTNSSPDSMVSQPNTANTVTSAPIINLASQLEALNLASQLEALNLQNNVDEVSISLTVVASHGSSIPTVNTIETRETDEDS